MSTTFDPKEVEKFSAIADEWWDEAGKFKPLHKFNPVRISYIREKIIEHFLPFDKLRVTERDNLSELKILDIGCGGGLVAEPFARMKAEVTAIDASEKNIAVAKIHAEKSGLNINYQTSLAEELAQKNQQYDVVFALEIIEHVADVDQFIKSCSTLVKPNGLLFVATINRNVKSLLLAKIAAEYVLRWVPSGTHDWKKFLKPSEVNYYATNHNLDLKEETGFSYNLLNDEWKRNSSDLDVNYMMVFVKR